MFTIELTDVPDKNYLVAEVWFGETLLAEINQEDNFLIAEFFEHKHSFVFPLNDFLGAIEVAKSKLNGTKQ